MSSDLNSHERYAIWDRAMARILLALHALTTCERKEFLDPLLALTWRKSEAERQFRHHNYVNIGSQKRLQERGFPVDTLADDIFPKLPERWKADPDVDLFFSSLFGGHQVSLEIARLGEDFKSTAAKLSKDEAEGKARLDYFFHRTSDLNNLARDIDVTVSQLYTKFFDPKTTQTKNPPSLNLILHPSTILPIIGLLNKIAALVKALMAENSLTKVRVISRIGKDLGAVGDAFIKQCQARGVDVPNVDDIHARFAKQTMYSSAIAFLMDRGQEFASPSTDPWITDAVKSIHALTDWAIKATDARTKMAVDAKSST